MRWAICLSIDTGFGALGKKFMYGWCTRLVLVFGTALGVAIGATVWLIRHLEAAPRPRG
jgi:hypothetical protein